MSRLFEELKRRKVIKVAAAYLVAAWVLLQVADLLVPILTLPDWTNRLVFLLLVIGFVPAVIISWAYELTPEGVIRDSSDEGKVGPEQGSKAGLYVIAVTFVVVAAGAGWWFMSADERWIRDVALPGIETHIEDGDYESAYQLWLRVEEVSPNDPRTDELLPEFTLLTSIPSEPAGATVFRRPHADPTAEWQELGRTPLDDIKLPIGFSVIRLELNGFEPAMRVIGSEVPSFTRIPASNRRGTHYGVVGVDTNVLDAERTFPDGFSRIGGWDTEIDNQEIAFSDFYLSKFEVTNNEYKEFVDAGGYSRQEYWEHQITREGQLLTWDEAMALLVDRSGRPGPATWEGGSYARGAANLPVSGVSWFEAAAYAKYVGRELPTVHHWRQGHSAAMLPSLLPMSNFNSDSLVAVGSLPGLDWGGNYDMLGNVREWCFNAVGAGRAILGAAYNDAYYMALESIIDPAYLDPFDRSPANGIRLAFTNDSGETQSRSRRPIAVRVDPQHPDPAIDAVYEVFRSAYDYDSGPLNDAIDDTRDMGYYVREVISFDAPYSDERIRLVLNIPKDVDKVAQVVINWPGSGGMLVDSTQVAERNLEYLVQNGRAVAVPILKGTYSRRLPSNPSWNSNAGRDLAIEQVKDFRRVIDYLQERPDIDRDAIAYHGFSWGGRVGAIVLAVEPRLKVGVLNQAGINFNVANEIDVTHYLPRVTQPVLHFSGRFDSDFVFETSSKPFFDLLGTPAEEKRHVVEPTGHFVARPTSVGETLDWLDKHLGPVD